jgi:hypothetical protein
MRPSLRTVVLGLPVVLGVLLGFDAKPAQAQYNMGAPPGSSYYAQQGPYNYTYMNPGYVARSPGYFSGGVRTWAPRTYNRRFGIRRSWAPSYAPIQRYRVGVRSI